MMSYVYSDSGSLYYGHLQHRRDHRSDDHHVMEPLPTARLRFCTLWALGFYRRSILITFSRRIARFVFYPEDYSD